MLPSKDYNAAVAEAIRLRVECRLGIRVIRRQTGLSVGTLSALLRPYPLTRDECRQKAADAHPVRNGRTAFNKYCPEISRHALAVDTAAFSVAQKGQIAEAAVLFRLTLHGFTVWRAAFEGNRVDWLVTRQGSTRYARLQVRWARRWIQGRPFCSLCFSQGTKRFTTSDCDFVIGYDLETDAAFVFPMAGLKVTKRVTCSTDRLEAWHLIDL